MPRFSKPSRRLFNDTRWETLYSLLSVEDVSVIVNIGEIVNIQVSLCDVQDLGFDNLGPHVFSL